MALFTGAGYLVDRWLGTRPWGINLGATLAFVGIIALVVRLGNTANRGNQGNQGNQGS
jgi:F0F1-type ATP synthase assembly protein I